MGKVLITGASSGIGLAVAQALSERGMDCVLSGRRVDVLKDLAASLQGDVEVVPADLRDENSIDQLFELAGSLDVLVNSAGVALHARMMDGSRAEWEEMFEVNVLGLASCCQRAVRSFDTERGGQIVNISSMSAHRVPPTGGFYAATKFAVRALSDGLRSELRVAGNPTRVTCISPGFVDTPLVDRYFAGREEQLESLRKEVRLLTPEDVAASVVHVLEAPSHVDFGDVLFRPTDQKV